MRSRLVRVLAGVPGGRRAVARARRVRARSGSRPDRRRLEELGGLARSAHGRDDGEIAVLGPAPHGLLEAVRAASPRARVTEMPEAGDERHVTMAVLGPFDVILDHDGAEQRRSRFENTFFHLRPGGSYVVPGGADELGPRRGPLGELLDTSAAAASTPREARGRRLEDLRLAIANHVSHRVVGPHLVLSHDIPDVLVKMREPEYNAYLERADTPHRLVRTIAAEPPPPPPAGIEGPDPRKPPMNRPINRATISLRDYRDVVVAPRQLLVTGRILLPDTFRHNQWPTLGHTQLVDLARRFARAAAPFPEDPPRLAGTYLHLDNEFRGHFGHLLTETLSRAWSWPEALELDPDVKVLVGATRKRPRPLEYELDLYEACGIPRDRIVVIEGPVRVDRLISGTGMFSHPQYVHPRIADTWRQVGDRLAERGPQREWPRRFFVSRRTDKRACLNGQDVESIFAEYGFETVYPEDYSLGEQVQLFRSAEVIGGYAGSGLFQLEFVTEPTHLITVGAMSYVPRNEYLMAAVHGHRIDGVVCRAAGKSVKTSYTFDVQREGTFLRKILDELP